MANKKKVNKVIRISPKIDLVVPGVTYSDLGEGDCFIMDKELWIVTNYGNQVAVNLNTGDYNYDLCDQVVIPVDVEIKWKKK